MRAADLLAELDAAPVVDLDALAGTGGIVVVAPHPDDESLGCGGLVAEAASRGRNVRVVVVSDGCGSHAGSRLFPPAALRALREGETLAAAARLGVPAERVTFLGLPDAGVPASGPEAERAAVAIAEIAREGRAGAVFVTWRHDPHCDHAAASAIVDLCRPDLPGVRVLSYPVWGWTLPPGHEVARPRAFYRLAVARHEAAKRAAIAEHRSQTTDLVADAPGGFRLERAMIDRLCGPYERFLEETA